MNVQVICKGSIKPSAPTPDHLRHYQLSYLDQIAPSVFIPLVFFYPNKEAQSDLTREQRCYRIKKSLSETLTHFYPLGGRVQTKLCVDCNDEGAYYVEAEARCQLSDILQNPNPIEINKLLPTELYVVNRLPLIIQVTFFDCGGMTIGVALNHEVADASSLFMFLNSWSALARGGIGESHLKTPILGTAASIFPPKDFSGFPMSDIRNVKDKIVANRFVFDAAKIGALINRYSDNNNDTNGAGASYQRRPTRFEALTSFITNRFMVATQPKQTSGDDKIFKLVAPVNIRTRMGPTLWENYFGNIFVVTETVLSLESSKDIGYYSGIVRPLRDSINRVNSDFVKKNIQESDEYLDLFKQSLTQVKKGEMSFLSFTSLCRFPIYEADFGWGKPVYVAFAQLRYNKVIFLDTNSGDGIEAWVYLNEEDMAKFESDEEIVAMFPPPNGRSSNSISKA